MAKRTPSKIVGYSPNESELAQAKAEAPDLFTPATVEAASSDIDLGFFHGLLGQGIDETCLY